MNTEEGESPSSVGWEIPKNQPKLHDKMCYWKIVRGMSKEL